VRGAIQATLPGAASTAVDETLPRAASSAVIGFLRGVVRRVSYRIGALSLYHRIRNRQVLTVAIFHRVLKREDPRWETALPPWTLTDDIFDQCLAFFRCHYALVTLNDVKASLKGARRLPPRSLLITFDDGFADNSDYALPLLRKHGAPAAVFISSDLIGRNERLWTEDLLWAFTAGRLHQRDVAYLYALLLGGAAHDAEDPGLVWEIVRRGPELGKAQVEAALSGLKIDLHRVEHPRQMLNRREIANLALNGISIGAHGKTHTALPFSSDITSELCSPRAALDDILALRHQRSVDTLSFPHGAYTSEIVHRALAAGYALAFTGDPELCILRNGFLASPLIGRIEVDQRRIAPMGRLRPEMLAIAFFTATRGRAGHAPRNLSGDQDQLCLRSGALRAMTGPRSNSSVGLSKTDAPDAVEATIADRRKRYRKQGWAARSVPFVGQGLTAIGPVGNAAEQHLSLGGGAKINRRPRRQR
jgi:peptidoglycan/xylan/chitin deacetylase (PgdA/CDA1 family)